MLSAGRRFCWETYSLISALLCFIYLSLCLSVLCAFSLCCGGWSIFQWSVISVPGLFIPPVYIKDFRWAAPCFCSCRSMCKHAQQWTCMCGHTHSIMQPKPILPPQLTQLGQQTAFHNSPNYPAAPCSVHLPRRATLIYNGAYVTSSGVSTLPLSKDTQKNSLHGKEDIPPYVCLSCWWLRSSEAVSAGLVLPQSLPPAATSPSWSVTVNKKIQSPAHHTWLTLPLSTRTN